MDYFAVALLCFLLGGGAVLFGLHKMTDGEIWDLLGGRRDYNSSHQPAQPVQYENPADRYDPFKQGQNKDPYI